MEGESSLSYPFFRCRSWVNDPELAKKRPPAIVMVIPNDVHRPDGCQALYVFALPH
jgi:hypothetical protein